MNEVSCKVFGVFFKPLAAKGLSAATMVAGTAITEARLKNKKERIDWGDFCAIMRNVRPHFSDDEYVALGRSYLHAPGLRFAMAIARLLFTPMDFLRWFNKPKQGVGNQMFNCVIAHHHERSATEVEMELVLPDGYEQCWDFYLISRGNIEELPRLLGLPRAQVEITKIPAGARYQVTFASRRPLLSRMVRVVTWPFTRLFAGRAAARELQEAHETLLERYEELEAARLQLDRQAKMLRTAHAINEVVQRDRELARTLDTITKALVEHAGFAAAEIVLGERSAKFGSPNDEPPLEHALEGAKLRAWPAKGADRGERTELLGVTASTLVVALQNATSFQALEDSQKNLEITVDQRTAELRQARDQLAGTVEELREAQGARERFFGNISHEIRTPLSLILLAAADIQARSGHVLDERAQAGLGSVADAARKLVRLVDELLLLAAGQEGKLRLSPEPTDVVALVDHLVSAWRPAAEAAGLELAARVPSSLIAMIDPVAIERVATNLVSNAVKYTPRGGRIDIELADEADALRLSVKDTGPGIDADLATRLFGRFERALGEDRRKIGTGLGLSLVKQLVEAHGGTVTHVPRPTGGSELRVALAPAVVIRNGVRPSRRSTSPIPTETTSVPSGTRFAPPGISRGTILLAEDDGRLAEMVARLLSDDYNVIVALDGEAALELVRQHQPQLLITDVDMPGINGIELSAKFRELTGDKLAPIIILSAVLDLGTRVAGLEAGAIDYVTKPFDPVELRARVNAQFRMRDLAVRLHRAEQISTLGILTSGLAHELRNPANGIVNAIPPLHQLIPTELTKPGMPVAELLDVMTQCAEQIGFLSRQLLSFRNGGIQLDLRPTQVGDLVHRAVALAHRALSGVEVRSDLGPDPTVLCAPPLMIQVLTNLIENAAHAAGEGGWVEIDGHTIGGRITVEVADSGPGVPIELRDRVFEPFFTTKAPGSGSGLGLPLARAIVLRHGGVLEIRERGARPVFVVDLPVSGVDVSVNPV